MALAFTPSVKWSPKPKEVTAWKAHMMKSFDHKTEQIVLFGDSIFARYTHWRWMLRRDVLNNAYSGEKIENG